MDDLRNLTFVVEGEEIKVNKTLMAASCVYFNTMLFGNTNESKQSTIELKGTPKEALKKSLNCDITKLFKLLVKWKEANANENCDDLFANLRLYLISTEDFIAYVMPTKLISSDDYLINTATKKISKRYTKCSDATGKEGVCVKKEVSPFYQPNEFYISLAADSTLSFHMKKSKIKMNVICFKVYFGSNQANFRIEIKNNRSKNVKVTHIVCVAINVLESSHRFDEYEITISPSTVSVSSVIPCNTVVIVHV
ncbi:hypothetical protein B4U80_14414 [Leptotrombidium deliense]|uniref:BTB domain-containing protein n=1 Tax=Leptotrombidium deliense TaxID=299467 RepID=A0A443RVX7_9ACAR|nr:hypothetical protein B4U80_14414 [Leptotrombidium deliense]